ncbi:MAG: hypothetical protein H8E17_19160 [Deltaproteobacteria bacterium]|nr:hypothetical protein [Deltaproteobacteria bacterium]
MESALKIYIYKCKEIFIAHHSKVSNVVPLHEKKEPTKDELQFFEAAIKEAEDTDEFEAFTKALNAGPLASTLERLSKKEERRRKKSKSKRQIKSLDEWKQDTARHATKGFFRNTGTYVSLWKGSYVNESDLLSTLGTYKSHSELIRLFVFDGFVPFHDRKQLNNISLPVGEFKKYTETELENLLRLSQSSWHGIVNPEIIRKASIWHIFTVREDDEYKGMSGVWMGGVLLSPIGWNDIGEPTKREGDIGIIGPVFLCIGEDANLAVEIRVRTNIFEYHPVYQKVRNDYLAWDSYNDEGEPQPRTFIHDIGDNGNRLRKICEIWEKINDLDTRGHLRYPTEAYVRSVMNLHTSWQSLMETFVGFVTVIESLLTPGTRQDLKYLTALRGAALLASSSERRMALFQILEGHYKTRSQIVHEGYPDKEDHFEFENMISHNLTEISRQIFLRYICLLHLGLDGELPEWILPDPNRLSSKDNRPKTIAKILDGLVLDPTLTDRLEKKMEEWGVYEDFIRKMSLRLFGKRPQK